MNYVSKMEGRKRRPSKIYKISKNNIQDDQKNKWRCAKAFHQHHGIGFSDYRGFVELFYEDMATIRCVKFHGGELFNVIDLFLFFEEEDSVVTENRDRCTEFARGFKTGGYKVPYLQNFTDFSNKVHVVKSLLVKRSELMI